MAGTSRSQGRIITNNPSALSSLLTTPPGDGGQVTEGDGMAAPYGGPPQRDLYDSLDATDADDDQYKYVSPNIESYDESAGPSVQLLDTERYSALTQGTSRFTSVSQNEGDMDYYNRRDDRYEDRNSAQDELKPRQQLSQPGRNSDNRVQSRTTGLSFADSYGGGSSMQVNARDDPEMENHQLREEREYQNQLQRRVKNQTEENEKIFIPKLDLSSMEDEGKRTSHGPIDISLRDSLEDENLDANPQDSLDWDNPPQLPNANQAYADKSEANPFTNSSNRMGGTDDDDPFPYRTKEEKMQALMGSDANGQREIKTNQNGYHEDESRLDAIFQSGAQSQQNVPVGGVSGPHPSGPAGPGQSSIGARQATGSSRQGAIPAHILDVYNQQNAVNLQPIDSDTTDHETAVVSDANNNTKRPVQQRKDHGLRVRELPAPAPQDRVNELPNYAQAGPGYIGMQDYDVPSAPYTEPYQYAYQPQGYPVQYYDPQLGYDPGQYYPDPNAHYAYADAPYEEEAAVVSTRKEPIQSDRPAIDYLERNKERLHKPPSGKKYGAMYQKKKESSIDEPKLVAPRKANTVKKSPAPVRKTNSRQVDNSDNNGGGAEEIWKRRAQRLAEKKDERLSGTKKPVANRGLKKFPSEGRVDNLVDNQSLPHTELMLASYQQPYTEPVRSELMSHGNSIDEPTTHTIYTENGQKFSVDINLKVLSPNTEKQNPQRPSPGRPLNQYSGRGTQQHAPPHHVPKQDFTPAHHPYQDPYHPAYVSRRHSSPERGQQHPPPDAYMQYGHPGVMDPAGIQGNGTYRPAYGYDGPPPPVQHQYYPGHQPYHPGAAPPLQQQLNYQGQQPYPGFQPAYSSQPYNQNGLVHDDVYTDPTVHDAGAPGAPSNKPPSPLGSPYQVLPPIGSAESKDHKPATSQGGISPRKEGEGGGGSYMNAYKKQKEKKDKKADYKAYTLDDFRRLNKEVRLGGLGPDVESETLREKREKASRQQEYARQIAERNKATVKQGPPTKQKTREEEEAEDLVNRRKIALNYAKSVPKPKVNPNPYTMPPQQQPSSGRNSETNTAKQSAMSSRGATQPGKLGVTSGKQTRMSEGSARPPPSSRSTASSARQPPDESDFIDLEQLQERHLREKEQAAMIRQNIQSIS